MLKIHKEHNIFFHVSVTANYTDIKYQNNHKESLPPLNTYRNKYNF